MYIVNWRNYWRKHFWIEKKTCVLSICHCDRRSRDRMVVWFTTTCAISAYHH